MQALHRNSPRTLSLPVVSLLFVAVLSCKSSPSLGDTPEAPIPIGVWGDLYFPGDLRQEFQLRVTDSYIGEAAVGLLSSRMHPIPRCNDHSAQFLLVEYEIRFEDDGHNEGSISLRDCRTSWQAYWNRQLISSYTPYLLQDTDFARDVSILPGGADSDWVCFEIPRTWSKPLLMIGELYFSI